MDFINIWQKPDYYPIVINFWNDLRALPPTVDPANRAKELVYMVKDPKEDKVIGVTTVSQQKIPQLKNHPFFVFRTLIHPKSRIPGLASKLTLLTRDFLESLFIEKKTDCIGLYLVTDKKELMTVRTEAVWRNSKLTFIGTTKDGRHQRVYYFDGAKI